MSRLAEFQALEATLAEKLKQLGNLGVDNELNDGMAFDDKHKLCTMMAEYNLFLRGVINLLASEVSWSAATIERVNARRQRQIRAYKKPTLVKWLKPREATTRC